MDNIGKPVPEKMQEFHKMVKSTLTNGESVLDFTNTEIAFAGLTDAQLKKAAWLFGLMNKHWLVGVGSTIGIAAIKLHLPFIESIVKRTIFYQFCGGTTLLETGSTIKHLKGLDALTILDYGAEGKESEKDFNFTMQQTIRSIEFAAKEDSVPVVSSKLTGMARFALLEKIHKDEALNEEETQEYNNILKRIDSICNAALELGVGVYFDAEETYIQNALDHLINRAMKRYNKEKAVVSNTYQLYSTSRLQYLIDSHNNALKEGYFLGAKLVRGAYMEKERERAKQHGYPSPIYPNKAATDDAFNMAVKYCIENYKTIAVCIATHNEASSRLGAEMIKEMGLPLNHPHFVFSQLYGMSDNLTFNLAHAGYNSAKYLPYGEVGDVVPYLIRRAQENSSITGDMTREHSLVVKEMKRRGLS